MGFATAVRTCLSKYADFSGRAQRSEFWYFVLFNIVVSWALIMLDSTLFGTVETYQGGFSAYTDTPLFSGLFSLAMLLPNLAVAVRRLHDTDRSGWWYLIGLVPLLGFILLIVWFASRGTPGPNRFGPDPLAGGTGFAGGGEDDMSESSIPRVPRDD